PSRLLGQGARREERELAALEIVRRHGPAVMATARRYSATPEDAEDAYQRGLEILLTKAPTTNQEELVPWLRTVVKHEAFALRRQRERHSPVTDDGELRDRPATAAVTHEQAERLERLRQGAEALGQLKPHEIRALLLKAEGFTYREICAITGWSYTKVNRLLTEGRRAFLRRVSGIQRGAECKRFEPLLSALADGEASPEELALLRPHMRTCLSCRAALREFRAAPQRVAGALPPALLATDPTIGPMRNLIESALGAAQHKAAAVGDRLHAAAELATGQKLAAVAASAAALAGGGTAIDEFANHQVRPAPAQAEAPDPRAAPPERPGPTPPPPSTTVEETAQEPAPAAESEPTSPPPPPPDAANEFDPAPGPPPASATSVASPSDAVVAPEGAGPGRGSTGGGRGSGAEFGL
ncbi:MAG TPA: sigma-70 family RNA polymerase sigma factor, partial [Thermoleophilaceae bacterium]